MEAGEAMKKNKQTSAKGRTLDETVVEMLKNDPAFREEYIRQMLKEDDPQMLVLSLRKVVAAIGGFAPLARETGLNRTQLYRTLSEDGKPEFLTLAAILRFLGMHFTIERDHKAEGLGIGEKLSAYGARKEGRLRSR